MSLLFHQRQLLQPPENVRSTHLSSFSKCPERNYVQSHKCFFKSKQFSARKFKDNYTLARELGSGAFSIVKLGVNKVTREFILVFIVFTKLPHCLLYYTGKLTAQCRI
jgi:hypothetical protein